MASAEGAVVSVTLEQKTPAAPKRKPIWKRQSVWTALLAAGVVVLEHYGLGGTMPWDKLALMLLPFLMLIGVEGGADIVKVYREWKARLEPLAQLLPEVKQKDEEKPPGE
jgi:hypothetical protein